MKKGLQRTTEELEFRGTTTSPFPRWLNINGITVQDISIFRATSLHERLCSAYRTLLELAWPFNMTDEERLHLDAVESKIAANAAVNGEARYEETKPIESTKAYRPYARAYELSKLPFLHPRRLKVIIEGAGCSAFSFAHEVESGALRNIDLNILEKNAGLGGSKLMHLVMLVHRELLTNSSLVGESVSRNCL